MCDPVTAGVVGSGLALSAGGTFLGSKAQEKAANSIARQQGQDADRMAEWRANELQRQDQIMKQNQADSQATIDSFKPGDQASIDDRTALVAKALESAGPAANLSMPGLAGVGTPGSETAVNAGVSAGEDEAAKERALSAFNDQMMVRQRTGALMDGNINMRNREAQRFARLAPIARTPIPQSGVDPLGELMGSVGGLMVLGGGMMPAGGGGSGSLTRGRVHRSNVGRGV